MGLNVSSSHMSQDGEQKNTTTERTLERLSWVPVNNCVVDVQKELWDCVGTLNMGSTCKVERVRAKVHSEFDETTNTSHEFPQQEFAVKSSNSLSPAVRNAFQREAGILARLGSHENLVRFHGVFMDKTGLFIAEELCRGGNLLDYIQNEGFLLEARAAHIMSQILSAVAHMHKLHIVHRDIKPENIMFCDETLNRIVLVDFGQSRQIEHPHDLDLPRFTRAGTPVYMSPELWRHKNVTGRQMYAADMWACGFVLYQMLMGKCPFSARSKGDMVHQICYEKVKFADSSSMRLSVDCQNLVMKLMEKDWRTRVCARDALRHEWLERFGDFETEEKIGEEFLGF